MATMSRKARVALSTLGVMFVLHCSAASLLIPPPPLPEVTTTKRPNLPATYWVTFSTRIRPGMRLPVTVHLLKPGDTATVSVRLTNHSDNSVTFSQAPSVSVTGGENSQTIYLEIPNTLKRPHWRHWFQYQVQVVATGDVSFNKSEVVTLYEKAFSIFVQTDKAIYKPGQTVKFRALAMNPDLTVLKEPMDIFIRDPNENGIKRWRNAQGYGDTGVVEKSMVTSTDPPLGDWTIDVTVRGYTETKTFTIDKYVLPKFEATLEVPEVVLTSEPGLRGKALAKYTFGKPLTEAAVSVTVQFEYFWKRFNVTQKPILSKTGTLNKNGELEFFFTKASLEELARKNYHYSPEQKVYLSWRRVNVTAVVTDVRTGRKMKAESMVRFSEDAAKVEFLPLTPNTYKPGLRYTAYVKVTQPDGKLFPNYQDINVNFNVTMSIPAPPPPPPPTKLSVNVTTPEPGLLIRRPFFPPPFYRPEKEVPVLAQTQKLTENGFLSIDVDVPSQATRINVLVESMGVSRRQSAQKAASPSGNYLQIIGQKQSPKVGEMAKLHVKTTERVENVIYQVYTKGVMISESEASAADAEGQKFTVSFLVTANMAPNCKVLVFYLRPNGEIVADSLSFKVDASSADQVNVTYSRQKVRPGEEVQMTVTARPGSVVFLLGVDKSVQLLKSGNDITQDMVYEELVSYDFGGGFHGYWRYMFICGWPYPSRGGDAYSIFRDAGVAMLTDGDLYRKPIMNYYPFGGYMRKSGGPVAFAAPMADNAPPAAPGEAASSSAERVRKFFPETWLWDIILLGPGGQSVIKTAAPDTITTWLTSAFAVHPQNGLALVQGPAKLTTFKDMFVSLDLPYSAIRGEKLCMKAFAFNYHAQKTAIKMLMGATQGIENIRVVSGQTYQNSEVVTRDLGLVDSNEVKEALFCFVPTGLGELPIRVNLSSDLLSSDAVERPLLVEPEGTPRVTNIPVILDVSSGATFQRSVPVQFPSDTVQGSQRITFSVAGDLLGPVFENIDDLLRMPYGCGEQNMLYFAPNVFLIDYLQRTNTYTTERAEKAENYMLIGYQKEIQYQHKDGSYSAFGNRQKNETGSMWLTAFVVKCFAQSMALQGDVVTIEAKIFKTSIIWMSSQQHPDGSFPEPGTVFNKNMQGGSAKGEALTAYVLIALAEATSNFKDLSGNETQKLQESITRARGYLEQQLDSLTDSYDVAIVTYALHVTNSTRANEAFQLLKSKAVQGTLTLHWERTKPTTEPRYYWQRQTDAINIEMTAYALLTYLGRNDVAGGLPIVRWMTSQRGPQGGFISTQDTVIGLQALALVATEIYQPTYSPITVTARWTSGGEDQTAELALNDSTRGLLQKAVVPMKDNLAPSNIHITAIASQNSTGRNIAVAEVTLHYNVKKTTRSSTFRLAKRVENVDEKSFNLRITARRTDGEKGGMTVIDVRLLTGYDVDVDSPLYDVTLAKTAEHMGRHYILYFDQMTRKPVTVTLPMVVTSGVPLRTEPGIIRIYDYYESGGDQELTVKYSRSRVRNFCGAMPTYEECGSGAPQ